MSETPSRQTTYEDAAAEPVSTRVVTAVADAKNTDPTALPPLYDVIDPDALDKLFQPRHPGAASITGRVTFTIAGCEVVVDSAGRVSVVSTESGNEGGLDE